MRRRSCRPGLGRRQAPLGIKAGRACRPGWGKAPQARAVRARPGPFGISVPPSGPGRGKAAHTGPKGSRVCRPGCGKAPQVRRGALRRVLRWGRETGTGAERRESVWYLFPSPTPTPIPRAAGAARVKTAARSRRATALTNPRPPHRPAPWPGGLRGPGGLRAVAGLDIDRFRLKLPRACRGYPVSGARRSGRHSAVPFGACWYLVALCPASKSLLPVAEDRRDCIGRAECLATAVSDVFADGRPPVRTGWLK